MKRRGLVRALLVGGLAGWAKAEPAVERLGHFVAVPQDSVESTWGLQEGLATWYGGRRWHGRRTASGEPFDRHAFTAAHRSLPFNTWVHVLNLANGRVVTVRINDRGPRNLRHVIDLSEAAAAGLDFQHPGAVRVRLEPVPTLP